MKIDFRAGCALPGLAPGQPGEIAVAVLGAADLDVRQIEPSSLKLHGAAPLRAEIRDINADGKPDLIAVFDMTRIKLHPNAKLARLKGSLKNSQRFWGEQAVTVVPSLSAGTSACPK